MDISSSQTESVKVLKKPTNTFEAWNYLYEIEASGSSNARWVEHTLLKFWNMDGHGTCNPSLASLVKKTNIKSKATIRKALVELENTGRWIISRQSGGEGNSYYYPQFVQSPKKFKDVDLESERTARRERYGTSTTKTNTSTLDNTETVLPNVEVKVVEEIAPTPIIATQVPSISGSKIVTELDATVEEFYREEKENDIFGEFAKYENRNIRAVLEYGDVDKYKINGVNPQQIYVPKFPNTPTYDALGGHWVTQFGSNYSSKFSYSYVSDIYYELLFEYISGDSQVFSTKLNEVHVAMSVFGIRGEGFNSNRVKLLMNTSKEKLTDQKMLDMRLSYEETLLGQKLSTAFERMNFYADQDESIYF